MDRLQCVITASVEIQVDMSNPTEILGVRGVRTQDRGEELWLELWSAS